ncbi:hypothetical protein K439DRAFT_487466 [Ramaria rubella]|nr:hypothetical protein K439DRAFT_487466 [Ramaria rubella]
MDDIPFFDTSTYALRGGIFADAFPPTSTSTATTTATTTATVPTAAATTTTVSTTTTTIAPTSSHDKSASPQREIDTTDNNQKHVQRARSADVLMDKEDQKDAGASMVRVQTMGAANGNARKRKSWFTAKDGSGGSVVDKNRRERSSSDADDNLTVFVTEEEDSQEQASGAPGQRPILPQRRSQASRSVSVSRTQQRTPVAVPPPSSHGGPGLSTSAPSSSSPTSPDSPAPSPPTSATSSSFLSTLKSRGAGMAEKQPVIKEAMRKWGVGVNWAAGLRKGDREGREGSRERGREREVDRDIDMEADHGEVWGGRSASGNGKESTRVSYADLRRKVEERKEREREKAVETGLGSSTSGSAGGSASTTRPIDIPGTDRPSQLGLSPSPERRSQEGRTPSIRSDTSPARKISPPGSFLAPSAPRTTTELHTTLRTTSPSPIHPPSRKPSGSESLLPDLPTPVHAPAPIRAQPKAATMTIPGIHARHRGEVMALGSEPKPSEAVPVDSQQQASTTGGTAIQSVYRLLRGTAGQGEAPHMQDETSLNRSSTAATATAPSLTKPTPPPLPPRSQTIPIGAEPPVDPVVSPASQALKSVVQQDAARQPGPPPLPARKVSASPTQTPRAALSGTEEAQPVSSLSLSSSSAVSSSSHSPSPNSTEHNADATSAALSLSNEKWRPPLPPRRNGSSISSVHATAPEASMPFVE